MNSLSREPNTVFIGRKPPMNYVLAVIMCFNTPDTKEVTLKARGQAITTAVDVAEITRHRFMKDLTASKINIGTDAVQMQEGEGTRNVSTIEITLVTETKPKKETKATQKAQAHTTEATKELA